MSECKDTAHELVIVTSGPGYFETRPATAEEQERVNLAGSQRLVDAMQAICKKAERAR